MGSENESKGKDRGHLFWLYKLEEGVSIKDAIFQQQSEMDAEDVKLTKQEFEEWMKVKKS